MNYMSIFERFFGRGPEGEPQAEQQSPQEKFVDVNKRTADLQMWMGQPDAKHPADSDVLEGLRIQRSELLRQYPELQEEPQEEAPEEKQPS